MFLKSLCTVADDCRTLHKVWMGEKRIYTEKWYMMMMLRMWVLLWPMFCYSWNVHFLWWWSICIKWFQRWKNQYLSCIQACGEADSFRTTPFVEDNHSSTDFKSLHIIHPPDLCMKITFPSVFITSVKECPKCVCGSSTMIVSSRIQFIYAYGQKWGKILKEKAGSNAKILWLWTDDAES